MSINDLEFAERETRKNVFQHCGPLNTENVLNEFRRGLRRFLWRKGKTDTRSFVPRIRAKHKNDRTDLCDILFSFLCLSSSHDFVIYRAVVLQKICAIMLFMYKMRRCGQFVWIIIKQGEMEIIRSLSRTKSFREL